MVFVVANEENFGSEGGSAIERKLWRSHEASSKDCGYTENKMVFVVSGIEYGWFVGVIVSEEGRC